MAARASTTRAARVRCGAAQALVLAAALLGLSCAAPPVVSTAAGNVSGIIVYNDAVAAYAGIPYAHAERWTYPGPPQPWTGTHAAVDFGAMCPQTDIAGFPSSENCLTANVWVPLKHAGNASANLPVMVWIYGGGFIDGLSAAPVYNGSGLAGRHEDTVIVSFNYRVGPFGFLALPELLAESPLNSTGMYGFADQVAALKWVQQNIRSFGGNPDHVTLFGESAGGISVCLHLVSPGSQGLFHAAIMESGNCNDFNRELPIAYAFGDQLGTAANCSDHSTLIQCLRNKTTDQILAASTSISGQTIFRESDLSPMWQPIVDQHFLPLPAAQLLGQGAFEKVPVLLGANYNSMALFVANPESWLYQVNTMEKYNNLLTKLKNRAVSVSLNQPMTRKYIDNIFTQYAYQKNVNIHEQVVRLLSDMVFLCGTRRVARYFHQFKMPSVYYYSWRHHPSTPAPPLMPLWAGAYHFSEVAFVFGNPTCIGYPGCTPSFTSAEKELSGKMMDYWLSFSETLGDPNQFKSTSAPLWPEFKAPSYELQALNLTITSTSGYLDQTCVFWDQVQDPFYIPPPPSSSGGGGPVSTLGGILIALACIMVVAIVYLAHRFHQKKVQKGQTMRGALAPSDTFGRSLEDDSYARLT